MIRYRARQLLSAARITRTLGVPRRPSLLTFSSHYCRYLRWSSATNDSGIFVPNATPRRRRQNIARLLYLSLIQAITFVPYLYGLAFNRPKYGLASWIPVFPGLVLFSEHCYTQFLSSRMLRPAIKGRMTRDINFEVQR